MIREAALAETFVSLAGALVGDADVLDFLYLLCERTGPVLRVDGVGVMLEDADGRLRLSSANGPGRKRISATAPRASFPRRIGRAPTER